ncbi:DUF6528 family protein [Pedobacter sp. SG908]|uniref:DUF6528 family protein n=1 Tax=Pedobacter sp. SG908 TaxID=2587135 RepID=UPI00142290C8|nr:DUF6528 family protein [Pedobacter sp. SG908]NII82718.1 hypothetical protein [Pedobacter sp. SG908]
MKTLNAKIIFFLCCSILFLACKKENKQQEANKLAAANKQLNANATANAVLASCCWIGTTNQANATMEAYDPVLTSWATPKWSFKPTTALGFNATTEIPLWGYVNDLKVRNNNHWGSGQVITAQAERLSVIAKYPGGQRIWATGFPADAGVHGMEILPDGNCVVAAAGTNSGTGGNYIRIYSSSQAAPNQYVNTIYPLKAAHQVLWDPVNNCLWAIGDSLKKYAYNTAASGGTVSNPKLSLITSYSLSSITPWGHDIAPYDGDTNKLLVTTNGGVYVFDKSAGAFIPNAITGAAQRTFVNSVSTLPGQNTMVQTYKDPGCPINGWCSTHVDFYNLTTGAFLYSRTVSSAGFYRGKSFDPNYL